jgi:hypothetical protein
MIGFHPRVDSIEGPFQRLSEELVDLRQPATQAGREIAGNVITVVELVSNQANNCPSLLSGSSFIAGSLGRRTQAQPLDDIDLYLVMDAPGMSVIVNGVELPLTAHYQATSTLLLSDPTLLLNGWTNADAVLVRIAGWLAALYPTLESGVGTRRKTCFVKLSGVNVDVTPVVWFSPLTSGMDQYRMPEGGGSPFWKATNPKQDQQFLSAANQAHHGDLLKIIRAMKWWNARHNGGRLKGIHLETMIVRALDGQQLEGWGNTLHFLFSSLTNAVQNACPDLTGLGLPLDSSLSPQDRTASAAALRVSHAFAYEASQFATTGNIPMALANWRMLFPLYI